MRKLAILVVLLVLRCSNAPASSEASCGKTGALGIEAGARQGEGVAIAEVLPGGPADLAGLRRGDVLVSIGGSEVPYACQVPAMVFSIECTPVAVVVLRDGTKIEKTIAPVDKGPLYAQACEGGDATACFRAAWIGGTAAPVKVLERACDRGNGAACTYLGYLYVTGTGGVSKNEIRSLDFYTRGCSSGDAHGCYNVGIMFDRGRGTTVNHARAATAYEQACTAGVSTACTDVGFLYERGRGTMKDAARAVEMYRLGCQGSTCERSNLRGCVNLGNVYRDGIGVKKDPEQAAELFRDACERKVSEDEEDVRMRACVLLGALEMNGLGVPQNVESGLKRSNEGCARGDAFGCFNVASHHKHREDFPRAAQFFQKSCDADDAEACFELALLYDEAKGVPFDPARSDALFRRACSGGFAVACSR